MEHKAKILIIDDDSDFIESTKLILESGNYEVVVARNGTEGLELVTLEDPDLIILDIMMDSMFEGFNVSAALKMTSEYIDYRDTPVIMVSSVKTEFGDRFDVPEGAEGIQGDTYMDKPVDPKKLLAKVAEMLHSN